jgi:glycosyltransferase involved in cell wall biosynthesis
MLNGEKIVVVMPAYNAARTLRQTYEEVMAHGIVDHVIVVDDVSHDDTVAIARTLDRVQVEVHPVNRGYGANQKTCYRLTLAAGAGIIIMIHLAGYRAFARKLLARLPLDTNSDDFVFCQPSSGTSYRIRLRDRGSDLPGAVFTGGFVNKLPEKRALWTGMSLHRFAFPFCALGAGSSDRLTNVRR